MACERCQDAARVCESRAATLEATFPADWKWCCDQCAHRANAAVDAIREDVTAILAACHHEPPALSPAVAALVAEVRRGANGIDHTPDGDGDCEACCVKSPCPIIRLCDALEGSAQSTFGAPALSPKIKDLVRELLTHSAAGNYIVVNETNVLILCKLIGFIDYDVIASGAVS